MRAAYTVLLSLLTPLVLLRLGWRGWRQRAYWRRIPERFGFVPTASVDIEAWVHAVSVGESLAALPLIEALIDKHGEGRVLVTTTTPTGSDRVRDALGPRVVHCYMPYDLPGVVRRFLARLRPRRVIVMETELWPNLFHALAQRGVPLAVANARLSPRSFAGYLRLRSLTRSTMSCCTLIAAQSEADAQRFRRLGADAARVHVMGNLKFDFEMPQVHRESGRHWRRLLGSSRPVWAAASTHEGEEALVLAAHREVLAAHPNAALILVPRHPQRFDAVARLVSNDGWRLARRSREDTEHLDVVGVWLGDSMGELPAYLEAADVAFVGGSLVPVGGHNILEPAALEKPVLFGPQMYNFEAARELLLDAGAALQVSGADDLAREVTALLGDPGRREAMGDAGGAAVAENRGALQRLLALLEA